MLSTTLLLLEWLLTFLSVLLKSSSWLEWSTHQLIVCNLPSLLIAVGVVSVLSVIILALLATTTTTLPASSVRLRYVFSHLNSIINYNYN